MSELESLFLTTANFDDILPEPVTVSLISFEEIEAGKKKDGTPLKIRRPVHRRAVINTYVPMKIFHKMMAAQEKIKRVQAQRKGIDGKLDEEGQEIMLAWMVDQVLDVWKLTEPDMTADELTEGLSFEKIMGLFGVFFGNLLKNLNNEQG